MTNNVWDFLFFFPARASTNAGAVDLLTIFITIVTVVVSLLIGLAILFLAVKYRRGHKVDRSNPPHEGILIETIWTLVPFAIAMVIFVWATVLYFSTVRPPADAMNIDVVGKQWMWKLQQPNGRWEMNELHVPLNRNVKLTMTSEDVIHSFYVPEFRLKQDVVPGRYSQMWFKPTKVGTYHLFCAEFCGTNHSGMVGSVVVMDPEDYQEWLASGNVKQTVAAAGEALFRMHGCSGCHSRNSSLRAPILDGIYGKTVAVQIPENGTPLSQTKATSLIVDDRYIHDSILLPEKEIAAGYRPIMPTFQGRLSESDILQLIAYIKSLSTSNGTSNGSVRGEGMGAVTSTDISSRTGFVPKNMGKINSAARAGQGAAQPFPGATGGSGQTGTMGRGGVNSDVMRNSPGTSPTSSVPESARQSGNGGAGAGGSNLNGGTGTAGGSSTNSGANGRTAQ
jgi:cytochrome c oxidase subunit 2